MGLLDINASLSGPLYQRVIINRVIFSPNTTAENFFLWCVAYDYTLMGYNPGALTV